MLRKKTIRVLGTILVVASLALLGGGLHFYSHIYSPISKEPGYLVFNIPRGATFRSVMKRLEENGIVTNPIYFELLALMKGKRGSLKAGEYALNTAMSPINLLEVITKGRPLEISLTVPEGFNLKEIAARLEAIGLGNSGELLRAAGNRDLLDEYGIPADSFEGYLFPDTYNFPRGTKGITILTSMADNFRRKVRTKDILARVDVSFLSLHEVVTLASLIEKETARADERPLISAVFHNRLGKGMLLQCDPTVIYAMKDYAGNIRKKDLKTDSPYNTYRYKGLPPGPIANPGLESILAALNPAEKEYLYFVSKKDGSHQFSSTLKEHNRAVRKYQLNKGG